MRALVLALVAIGLVGEMNCIADDVLDAKTVNLVIRETEPKTKDLDIEVSGLGEAGAPVDHVSINVFVRVIDQNDQVKPKLRSDLDVKGIIQTAENHGVRTNDIDGTHVSIGPHTDYDREKKEYVRAGYKADRRITIVLRDLSKLDDLLTGIVKISSAQIEGIQFGSEKLDDTKKTALHLAVADAKTKAQLMADAFGLKVGKILEINQSSRGRSYAVGVVEPDEGQRKDLPESSFIKNTIPVKSQVEVKFELIRQ